MARSAVLSRNYNVFNGNLAEYHIKCIVQVLGGCLELQVSHIKGCRSPLPSLVEVDWFRHLVNSRCNCLLCLVPNFLGCFWDDVLPFMYLADLDSAGIVDIESIIDAAILGLA